MGATEWLEVRLNIPENVKTVLTVTPPTQGYLSMLHLKAVAYFSLDQAVMGNLSANQEPDF